MQYKFAHSLGVRGAVLLGVAAAIAIICFAPASSAQSPQLAQFNAHSTTVRRTFWGTALMAGGLPLAPLVLTLFVAGRDRGYRRRPLLGGRTAAHSASHAHADQTAVTSAEISGQLQHLQDDLHRRMARTLHDSTAQNLAAVLLNIARLEADASINASAKELLQQCASLVEQSSAEVRGMCYELYPPGLDELGLASALRSAAAGVENRRGIAVRLDLPEHFGRYDSGIELAMFHVVQQALSNIENHSGSCIACVSACTDRHGLTISIEDHGCDIARDGRSRLEHQYERGLGMASMEQRIRHVGGELQITSTSSGTRVTARVPFTTQVHRTGADRCA